MSHEMTVKCDGGCGKKVTQENPYLAPQGWAAWNRQTDSKTVHACSPPCTVKVLRADANALEEKHAREVAVAEDHAKRVEVERVAGLDRAARIKADHEAKERQRQEEIERARAGQR